MGATIGVAPITQYTHMRNKTSNIQGGSPNVIKVIFHTLKVLWIFKNIFETLHDLNDSDEKTKMMKTSSQNSNWVKSYAWFKVMQFSI